jgi:hypothetical protein
VGDQWPQKRHLLELSAGLTGRYSLYFSETILAGSGASVGPPWGPQYLSSAVTRAHYFDAWLGREVDYYTSLIHSTFAPQDAPDVGCRFTVDSS